MANAPSDDYYALLGIDPDANAAELRRAWRRLALRWHPDRAGASTTFIFQTLSAAYSVLSDPAARDAYDRQRRIIKRPAAPRPRDTASAPAVPKRAPSVMLSRLTGQFNALAAGGIARRAEDGVIELFLTAQEAREGGMATISMRVRVRCPDCQNGDRSCGRCAGGGTVEELFSAWLAVRPGVGDGVMLAPSAQLRGVVRPVSFRVRVPTSS